MDDVEKSFQASTQDDSWTFGFEYSQSTHQIVVDLDVTVIPEYPQPLFVMLPLIAATILVAILARSKTVMVHGSQASAPVS
ncbi:hypothetical protein MUP00_10810 [Candidatus Bathyarchaeota archaeon]|nr:hypothetical protein [Candidatus Bathyarchaeota archaeon]